MRRNNGRVVLRGKEKGPVRVFDLRVRFGIPGMSDYEVFTRFVERGLLERGGEGGRWEIRVKRSDSLSSPVLFHQPEGRRGQPPRAPVRHLGPVRNNTCRHAIRRYGVLSTLSLAKNLIIKGMDRRNKAGVALHESSVHSDETETQGRSHANRTLRRRSASVS